MIHLHPLPHQGKLLHLLSLKMDETTEKWQCLDTQMTLHDATNVAEYTGCHQPLEQPAIKNNFKNNGFENLLISLHSACLTLSLPRSKS